MEALIEALGLQPRTALLIILLIIFSFISWVASSIKSDVKYLVQEQKNHKEDHGKLQDQVNGISRAVARLEGYIFKDEKGE